jgi:hypothetical protein
MGGGRKSGAGRAGNFSGWYNTHPTGSRGAITHLRDGDFRAREYRHGRTVDQKGRAGRLGERFHEPRAIDVGHVAIVAVHQSGHEAIIDFKYAGRSKYYDLLKDGRALQLATYAHGRSQDSASGRIYPAVAYLVLADAQLYTPSGSPLAGGDHRFVVDGRHIRDVWDSFTQAIEAADGWLSGDEAIPARPLQASHEWPMGADMALSTSLRENELHDVCRYCDYKRLCGIERLI